MRFGTATTQRCECGKYNLSNQDEKICHTCALVGRICSVCENAIDAEKEEEDVRDYCDTNDIEIPEGIFPLEFGWLLRNNEFQQMN